MAELNKVYSLAQLYDIAFGRSISREIDFLLALFRREAGRDATSLVDIACGPGYHARAAALRVARFMGLEDLQDTEAGTLPIGGMKRLEVARTLATEPSILLLDG